MKADVKYIKTRKKKETTIVDGTFSCPPLENLLNAKKKNICTFVISGLEFNLEVE